MAVFPRTQRFVNLSTFVPEAVTPDIQELGHQTDLALNSMVLGGLVESRLTYRRYDVDVLPQESGTMTITPLGFSGRHFNEQFRNSHSLQWLGAFSRGWTGRGGEHLVKGGLDVLHAQFTGRSSSRDVEVRDLAGTLRERVSFAGEARQSARATDVAAYLQDRWRPHDRLLVEYGVRLDRDGVMTTMNFSPRIGVSWSVWPDSRGVIRGGLGRFVQRTPLAVASFEEFERRTVTVVGAAGEVTTTYTPELVASAAPQAYIASLEYNHRLTPSWSFKASQVHRSGSREFLVDPQAAEGRLILRGDGESRYVESEATLGYVDGRGRSLFLTYVYTDSTADYNNLDRYFGNLRQPLIRANTFTRTDVDVPHRVIARGTLPVLWRWQVVAAHRGTGGLPVFGGGRRTELRRPTELRALPGAGHARPGDQPRDHGAQATAAGRRARLPGTEPLQPARRAEQRRLRPARRLLQLARTPARRHLPDPALTRPRRYSRWLRSIQAFFSWAFWRRVARSAVA